MSRGPLAGYAFIFPWLIALVAFVGYPFVAGFYFSFCDYPPLKSPLFVGTSNYTELLRDHVFQRSMATTLTYASVAVPLGVFLAVSLGMALNTHVRGQSFYRVIFYLPHLVPTVVVALLWLWIFNPHFGLLNALLGGIPRAIDILADVFFALDSAGFLRPWAALLLAGPLLAAAVKLLPGPFSRRPRLRSLLLSAAAAWIAVGVVSLADALLRWLTPYNPSRIELPGWLTDGTPFPASVPLAPPWALWALILMSMWGVGQMAVIYLAKLQDVPVDLYEAADIDGAGWWRKAWHVTIPMISPVILFNAVMGIIGAMQVFAEPYIMTNGGPEDKTRMVAMFIYDQAFQYQRIGYASAVAWVLFLVIVILTLLTFRISRGHVYYAGR